jgi:hypothetical protein
MIPPCRHVSAKSGVGLRCIGMTHVMKIAYFTADNPVVVQFEFTYPS